MSITSLHLPRRSSVRRLVKRDDRAGLELNASPSELVMRNYHYVR